MKFEVVEEKEGIPFFAVLIGAFLTMPLLFISRFLNKLVVAKGILAVGALGGLFYVVYKVMELIPVPRNAGYSENPKETAIANPNIENFIHNHAVIYRNTN